ncbi:MAG: sodium:proton antiporter [Pseudonocardiaceae bacterium]|nr:MAG: sodium:proton antiporter [Pseudonocardiaceae bacterium]
MAADDDLPADAEWNRAARDETDTERLDRNWNDLLQELRVSQTGVQLLTGLLLTVPFQSRFPDLLAHQRVVYLVALGLAITATALLIAPVLLHRLLFRKHARASLVAAGQGFAIAGLGTLGLAVVAVLDLIFDVVLGATAGVVAAACGLVVFTGLWLVFPLVVRHRVD